MGGAELIELCLPKLKESSLHYSWYSYATYNMGRYGCGMNVSLSIEFKNLPSSPLISRTPMMLLQYFPKVSTPIPSQRTTKLAELWV